MSEGFYIVGIGASAGGLEALEKFFKAMPHDSGMAFVIIQHLSPDFKSLMDELLARHTSMPIHRVEDGMMVEPNSLYLIPPRQELTIKGGQLTLSEKKDSQALSLPIDHFFSSLAADCGDRSIAVVLSGTGSDGSRGIRDVHDVGGLVVVQSPESSKFDGMPKSAMDTEIVDVVSDIDSIPSLLLRFVAKPIRSEIQLPPADESGIEQVFRLLQTKHRIDFRYYKPSTIGRRLERRIQLSPYPNLDDYVRKLVRDPVELDQLYRDLLIGVTHFFRDEEAFNSLQQDVLPDLLKAQKNNSEFRVWVAACGTGEEAYSIAIAIDECMKQLGIDLRVKVFATDVHQSSLDRAHWGRYSASSLENMSTARVNRYFHKNGDEYQIIPAIRETIVFAPHNLLHDAPFTRLDLVTCRNLLIYLQPKAQEKVISAFHFSLRVGGAMFLGASENLGDLAGEFDTLNDRWKIYRKRRDVRLPADIGNTMALSLSLPRRATSRLTRGSNSNDNDLLATYDELLSRHMPMGFLVGSDQEVVHIFGGAGKYLQPTDGRPSENFLENVHTDLKLALTGGLQRVEKSGNPISYERLKVSLNQDVQWLSIKLEPLSIPGADKKCLVTLTETCQTNPAAIDSTEALDIDDVSRRQLLELEQELRYSKENLQATIEELETSNEELQATNEEMVAANEELQSTNEELHSVNEELYTVNAEYQNKIAELTELTNDMENLFVSTEVHTLFLDKDLRIRKYTPDMANVFNLVAYDVGRQIAAFSSNINCDNLHKLVSQVLESGEPCEQRVQDAIGNPYLMRILPYRVNQQTQGVVLTLIDISQLVEAQNQALQEQENFQRAVAANRDGTWDWKDISKDAMWWSDNCYTLLGYEPGEFPASQSSWLQLVHKDDRQKILSTSLPSNEECYVEIHQDFEYRMKHKRLGYRWYRHRALVDYDDEGKPTRMTGSVGDIHARKCAEFQYIEAIRRRDNFLAMLSHELRNPISAVLNAIEYSKAHQASSGATQNGDATAIQDSESTKSESLVIVERQTRHMARILDDLLDVARYGQNKIEFRSQTVDLVKLGNEVIEAVDHLFVAKNQKLIIQFDDSNQFVLADPARIKQAQINLLDNASKYTHEGGNIWYRIHPFGDQVRVVVADNGDGMEEEALESVFDLFVQHEESLARTSGGMGVGLSLTRMIVKAHNGNIYAESEGRGKGSTFTIDLPAVTAPGASDETKISQLPVQGNRMLVIEDNADAGEMLTKTLRLRGLEVALASNGQEAISQFYEFDPDVALIDIGLPVMDGYELARKLRGIDRFRDKVLIALTGYGQKEDKESALEAGFNAHLVKPLDHQELYRLLENLKPARSR